MKNTFQKISKKFSKNFKKFSKKIFQKSKIHVMCYYTQPKINTQIYIINQ